MNFREAAQAVDDAKTTLRAADHIAAQLATLLVGRLRKATSDYFGCKAVVALKKELRSFNMTTHQWKDQP